LTFLLVWSPHFCPSLTCSSLECQHVQRSPLPVCTNPMGIVWERDCTMALLWPHSCGKHDSRLW
jgi:hypothetical protein